MSIVRTSSLGMAVFLSVAVAIIAGCSSAPPYRKHPELQQRQVSIKNIGLLRPSISTYECQYAGMGYPYENIRKDEWSPYASDEIMKAFISEVGSVSPVLVLEKGEEREFDEMANLYAPVNSSLWSHAYLGKRGAYPQREPFPEKLHLIEYSLGPAEEAMSRRGVDAIWIINGSNAVPTTGAKVYEAIDTTIRILGALTGGSGWGPVYKNVDFSMALVDKDGTILFYTRFEVFNDSKDLRNRDDARYFVTKALSDFREAAK